MNRIKLVFILFATIIASCNEKKTLNNSELTLSEKIDQLNELNDSLPKPKEGDWLLFRKEQGQTFNQYVKSEPIYPNPPIDIIYIQPIGKFDQTDSIVLNKSFNFLEVFFGLEVKQLATLPDGIVPHKYKRLNDNQKQLQTRYILDSILIPRMPKDAIISSAITSKDLFPKDDWNFVFGQAYLKHRVCVSSIKRFKDASSSQTVYLKRFMRTLTHEICHTFSLKHCKTFRCIMNGSNSLVEADNKPIYLCPECLKKILWCTNYDIIERFENLITFCEKNNLKQEREFYKKSIEIIDK